MKSIFRITLALALAVGIAGIASAQTVKGVAEVGLLKPVTKVQGTTVVTTLKIKNLSKGAIAGLKIEEFWYDKDGNPLPGDSKLLSQPLAPGEVMVVELKTRKNPQMDRNSYRLTHANGTVNSRVLDKIE